MRQNDNDVLQSWQTRMALTVLIALVLIVVAVGLAYAVCLTMSTGVMSSV